MKNGFLLWLGLCLILFVPASLRAQSGGPHSAPSILLSGDLGSGFYYQGYLAEAEEPVNGLRQMSFTLYDGPSNGQKVGTTFTLPVPVTEGQFHVVLPWGPDQIDGKALWLEIMIEDGIGSMRNLGRKPILAVPYAMSLQPGAQITRRVGDGAVVNVSNQSKGKSANGLIATGADRGLIGETTGADSADAGVRGIANASTGQARGGSFYSRMSYAIEARSDGASEDDAVAIWAENSGKGGALWARSQNQYYPTLLLENTGDGPLIRGFGSQGFLFENFRVEADGTIRYQGALVGAFPRPHWDTGWQNFQQGQYRTILHGMGGDVDNYLVDMQCRDAQANAGISNLHIGEDYRDDHDYWGAAYDNLTSSHIRIHRSGEDPFCDQIRVRIWIYK